MLFNRLTHVGWSLKQVPRTILYTYCLILPRVETKEMDLSYSGMFSALDPNYCSNVGRHSAYINASSPSPSPSPFPSLSGRGSMSSKEHPIGAQKDSFQRHETGKIEALCELPDEQPLCLILLA